VPLRGTRRYAPDTGRHPTGRVTNVSPDTAVSEEDARLGKRSETAEWRRTDDDAEGQKPSIGNAHSLARRFESCRAHPPITLSRIETSRDGPWHSDRYPRSGETLLDSVWWGSPTAGRACQNARNPSGLTDGRSIVHNLSVARDATV